MGCYFYSFTIFHDVVKVRMRHSKGWYSWGVDDNSLYVVLFHRRRMACGKTLTSFRVSFVSNSESQTISHFNEKSKKKSVAEMSCWESFISFIGKDAGP